eukprot:scaffold932_cov97-Isochrysis_galbana.AAC.6
MEGGELYGIIKRPELLMNRTGAADGTVSTAEIPGGENGIASFRHMECIVPRKREALPRTIEWGMMARLGDGWVVGGAVVACAETTTGG